jgi:hypothetical protein
MAELTWDEKGKAMFDKVMEAVPEPMREMAKSSLMPLIEKRASGNPVTEEVITNVIKEDLPEPQKSFIKNALGL